MATSWELARSELVCIGALYRNRYSKPHTVSTQLVYQAQTTATP